MNECDERNACSKVEVLSTLMSDEAKLFMEIHKTEPQGMCNFVAGLRVASELHKGSTCIV